VCDYLAIAIATHMPFGTNDVSPAAAKI
jgi:hypothetical protein